MGRILALDIGSKRTGLAITDETKTISQPVPYTVSLEDLFETITELNENYQIEKVIIGLPKSLSGEEGPQAKAVRSVSDKLASKLSLPIEFFDERLTTKQAEMINKDNLGLPIDALAAQQLLEQYLKLQNATSKSEYSF